VLDGDSRDISLALDPSSIMTFKLVGVARTDDRDVETAFVGTAKDALAAFAQFSKDGYHQIVITDDDGRRLYLSDLLKRAEK
jgi:hypothetical protein